MIAFADKRPRVDLIKEIPIESLPSNPDAVVTFDEMYYLEPSETDTVAFAESAMVSEILGSFYNE